MYIYNVTLKVDWSIAEEWIRWMQEEHIPEVMATGCFESGRLLKLLEVDEEEGPSFAAQYTSASLEAYQRYIKQHAATLRQKSFDKWGERFIAFRTLMQLVQ